MSTEEATEAAAVAALAMRAQEPHELTEDVWGTVTPDGALRVTSVEKWLLRPARKRGQVEVHDIASLNAYLARHGTTGTTVYADARTRTVTAVIDDHDTANPGWAGHRVTLNVVRTAEWELWRDLSGKLVSQLQFAEVIEDRAVDCLDPDAATMLELAQSFQATRDARFEGGIRLASGETRLSFAETINAAAGRKGDLAIPQVITLALRPFDGTGLYKVPARFRYRVRDGALTLGIVLDRPDDIERQTFDELCSLVTPPEGALPVLAGVAPDGPRS